MLGDKIKQIRKDKNISQKEFAKILKIPVSTLANYENNHREPSIDMLNKIAESLGVSISELAGTKKNILETAINLLLEEGFTIEKISEETKIPIIEINNILNKKNSSIENYLKLFNYLGYKNEDVFEIIIEDTAVDSIYNNDGSDDVKNILKSMFLGEKLPLDKVLMNFAEEDRDFLTKIFAIGALNHSNKLTNSNNHLSVNELDLLNNYNLMNEEGQKKLIEYSNDIVKIYLNKF